MVLQMRKLKKSEPAFQKYKEQFDDNWTHPDKTAKVKSIYVATVQDIAHSYRGKKFNDYRKRRKYRLLYHGTKRACRVGESGDSLKICADDECSLCSILRHSFEIEYATGGMFGQGIYSSPISSKADTYVKNHHTRSHLHAMLLCQVVGDEPQFMYQADNFMRSPDFGYNCVEGLTRENGGSLNYPEVVVYKNEAIIPVGLIIYTRKGWQT